MAYRLRLATGACNPDNPRNRRRRASILIEARGQTLLIDTGPDLREQLIMAQPERIDAVIYTHSHADHIHGVDDLRFYVYRQRAQIPAYMDALTHQEMQRKFGYLFPEGAAGMPYPPLIHYQPLTPRFRIAELEIESFPQPHGNIISQGLKLGRFAYSTDCVDLPVTTLDRLRTPSWMSGLWTPPAQSRIPRMPMSLWRWTGWSTSSRSVAFLLT